MAENDITFGGQQCPPIFRLDIGGEKNMNVIMY